LLKLEMQDDVSTAALIVECSQVKRVKILLEQHGQYDKGRKIVQHGNILSSNTMVVPTLMQYHELSIKDSLKELGFGNDIEILDIVPLQRETSSVRGTQQRDLLRRSVSKWI